MRLLWRHHHVALLRLILPPVDQQTRVHRMPFGAELWEDGAVRFRLWAPLALGNPALNSTTRPEPLPMRPLGDGWHELTTDAHGPARAIALCCPMTCACPIRPRAYQPKDVHGPSEVDRSDGLTSGPTTEWRGRPWEEAVVYELHVGDLHAGGHLPRPPSSKLDAPCRTRRDGDRDHAGRRFSRAAATGATTACCRLRPTPATAGPRTSRRWSSAAHRRGLMVLLDVVYNHFGPDGNYLRRYRAAVLHRPPQDAVGRGDQLSTARAAARCAISSSRTRCYWLEEYHFDGLRLDAVHAIVDDSPVHFLDGAGGARAGALHRTGRSI